MRIIARNQVCIQRSHLLKKRLLTVNAFGVQSWFSAYDGEAPAQVPGVFDVKMKI